MAHNRVGWRTLAAAALGLSWPLSIGLAADGVVDASAIAPAVMTSTSASVAISPPLELDSAEITPWIHPNMPATVAGKLETGFRLAVARVRDVPECSALFVTLGADALEILKTGLYLPTNVQRELVACRRSVAQTIVGSAPTWICRNITAYPDETVAAVLIHEALHHAGLPEDATGRTAKSSGSITRTVTKQCRLDSGPSGKQRRR
jgi:hypothetical protein